MSSDRVKIAGWLKVSFIDFPGTVSTVLFFAGCNLRCPYCHNPDIVLNRNEPVDYIEITNYLKKRKGIIDGVVLSGGEPTLHESLPDIVKEIKSEGLKVKLDTNGLHPEMIKRCGPDYLALDIKTDPDRYDELGYSGASAKSLLAQSLDYVKSMGDRAEVRITAASLFVNEMEAVKIAAFIEGTENVFIQPFKNNVPLLNDSFSELKPLTSEELSRIEKLISSRVKKCVVRGQ